MFNPLRRTEFVIPAERLICSPQEKQERCTTAPYYRGIDLAKELTEGCDLPCTLVRDEEPSPRYCLYYFNLTNHKDFNKIDKALLHLSIKDALKVKRVKETRGAMFAIQVDTPAPASIGFEWSRGVDNLYPNKFSGFIGVGPNYEPIFLNLLESPHILLAGASGSGKSTALNTFLCSLLMRVSPDRLGFIFIDPKLVELAPYEGIPHQIGFAHDLDKAKDILSQMSGPIMDARYEQLKRQGVKSQTDLPEELQTHYLIVIDEFADLMLADPTIGDYVARIAQKGRAAGIHLLIATQRPTVKVLDGLIKANLTTRVALKTASIQDSINILDHKGAEQLQGRGDALIKLPTNTEEIRVQCANITTEQVEKITGWWLKQNKDPNFPNNDS